MTIVAMSREMGSLGKDVASGLAKRMGRGVVYQEIIDPAANRMRVRRSHVQRFLDGTAGLWERLTADRTSVSAFTAEETFRLVRGGAVGVIRGWGAVHLLKEIPHVIRVRICAPLELRLERMMERLATDDHLAVRQEIDMSEEAHDAIVRRHFGARWRDPEHYDLVLSTERLTAEECVDEVERMMSRPRFQETPESLQIVEDRWLEWAVRAALRRDPRTASSAISVSCRGMHVRLGGVASTRVEIAAARAVAAGVEREAEIELAIRLIGMAHIPSRRVD